MEVSNIAASSTINVEGQLKEMKGTFVSSLRRNYKQIRDDRALKIAKTAQTLFKRKVEDLANNIDDLKMDRDNLLDLNGTSTTTIISASDFNADEFVEKDLELGLKIRNLEIKYDIAFARYNELFGGEN